MGIIYSSEIDLDVDDVGFIIRPLSSLDININYYALLAELSTRVESNMFPHEKEDEFVKSLGENHIIYVVEDVENNQVIASATLLIEPKIINNFSKVGHIEDVVVNSEYRGRGVGKMVGSFLTDIAKERGCYKCTLDCGPDKKPFYESCGYRVRGYQMAKYFNGLVLNSSPTSSIDSTL